MVTGKRSTSGLIFDICNYALMVVLMFITLFPFWYILVGSLNEGVDFRNGGVYFWPRVFTFENYKTVFENDALLKAFGVTISRTVLGTLLQLLVTTIFAYGYCRTKLSGKKIYSCICLIPMFVSGGMIPTYLLYSSLGLIDNYLVYIIPGAFSYWNVLIIKAFWTEIPESLQESARVEGASEYYIYWHIMMPLSGAVLAALALFTAVGHWNAYFDSMMYTIRNTDMYTLQHIVMRMVKEKQYVASIVGGINFSGSSVTSDSVQYATIIVATLPVIIVYPFLQKFFVKGVMVGSLKG